MDVKDVLFMNKGDGENSYAHNSAFTQKVASMTKPALEEAVRSLFSEECDFHGKRVVNVADLGCAAGPNTFFVMSTVLEAVDKICKELNFHVPEIQFYLNDLPGNDFNTLFNALSGFCQTNKNLMKVPYFVMGAPGSFHHRLFPQNSMDLIHSSYSVHWLSQVRKLNSLNKGKMYISKTSPPIVKEGYLAQFKEDFTSFLESRSQEMVSNGCIILILQGRSSPDPATRDANYVFETLANAISLMVSQGLVEEEKLDSFDVPYYTPSKEEVEELINMEGSFTTERLEILEIEREEIWSEGSKVKDVKKMADVAAKSIRGFTESIISHHFGEETANELYGKFIKTVLIDEISKAPTMIANIVVTLRKRM